MLQADPLPAEPQGKPFIFLPGTLFSKDKFLGCEDSLRLRPFFKGQMPAVLQLPESTGTVSTPDLYERSETITRQPPRKPCPRTRLQISAGTSPAHLQGLHSRVLCHVPHPPQLPWGFLHHHEFIPWRAGPQAAQP